MAEAEFLCCSELRWPPQTSGTTCPTSSASETRSGSALLQERRRKTPAGLQLLFTTLDVLILTRYSRICWDDVATSVQRLLKDLNTIVQKDCFFLMWGLRKEMGHLILPNIDSVMTKGKTVE